MSLTNKELQDRLEKDENAYLKIQAQANRQHAEALNQLADVCALVQRLIARLDKQDARIKTLESAVPLYNRGPK